MSTSIWNLKHPLRTGHISLAHSGKEKFGTVIRHGRMNKTVTVSITSNYLFVIYRCGYLTIITTINTKNGFKEVENSTLMMKRIIVEQEIKL